MGFLWLLFVLIMNDIFVTPSSLLPLLPKEYVSCSMSWILRTIWLWNVLPPKSQPRSCHFLCMKQPSLWSAINLCGLDSFVLSMKENSFISTYRTTSWSWGSLFSANAYLQNYFSCCCHLFSHRCWGFFFCWTVIISLNLWPSKKDRGFVWLVVLMHTHSCRCNSWSFFWSVCVKRGFCHCRFSWL